MNRNALATLLHPFDAGLLPPPAAAERVLLVDPEPGFTLPGDFDAAISAVQPFRPHFIALKQEGRQVSADLPEQTIWDHALILLGRHRGRGERRLADALRRVVPGGLIVVGGANANGAASFAKRAALMFPVEGRAAKHHGTVFWFRRPDDVYEAVAALDASSNLAEIEGGFQTAPGMFSHGRVDPGSALLAEHLPTDLAGDVADFAAGWGFLSVAAARRSPGIRAIDLYEADWEALAAARCNLARLLPDTQASFHWRDLAGEEVPRRYDAIVMNPPFHEGRAADPSLGEAIIRRATAALKPGGRLFMVANRQLPYEATLAKGFARSGELARDAAFKVLWGRR